MIILCGRFFSKKCTESVKIVFLCSHTHQFTRIPGFHLSTTHLNQSLLLLLQDHPPVLIPPHPHERTSHSPSQLFTKCSRTMVVKLGSGGPPGVLEGVPKGPQQNLFNQCNQLKLIYIDYLKIADLQAHVTHL